jgi:hypothetical protein
MERCYANDSTTIATVTELNLALVSQLAGGTERACSHVHEAKHHMRAQVLHFTNEVWDLMLEPLRTSRNKGTDRILKHGQRDA